MQQSAIEDVGRNTRRELRRMFTFCAGLGGYFYFCFVPKVDTQVDMPTLIIPFVITLAQLGDRNYIE